MWSPPATENNNFKRSCPLAKKHLDEIKDISSFIVFHSSITLRKRILLKLSYRRSYECYDCFIQGSVGPVGSRGLPGKHGIKVCRYNFSPRVACIFIFRSLEHSYFPYALAAVTFPEAALPLTSRRRSLFASLPRSANVYFNSCSFMPHEKGNTGL